MQFSFTSMFYIQVTLKKIRSLKEVKLKVAIRAVHTNGQILPSPNRDPSNPEKKQFCSLSTILF